MIDKKGYSVNVPLSKKIKRKAHVKQSFSLDFFVQLSQSSIFFVEYCLHILVFSFPPMHYVHVFFRGS